MDLGLKDKRFLIGGGSRGLGNAIAQVLVDEGAHVLLMSRDGASLEKAAADIGPAASWVAVDIASPGAVETLQTAVDDKLGGLDGMLINAGGPPPGEVLGVTDEQWAQSFELLIGGPIRILRALTPKIEGEGSVLFITSSSVRQPIPNLDTSNVLRPGVAAMAKVLARELGPKIRVNSLAPGRFDTDRVRTLDKGRAEAQGITVEQQVAQMNKQIPLGRYGEPMEMGRIGAFLLSPAASYLSGISVQADGAMVTAIP
ncbi:MAG: SDR family oxidoreductase [Thermomicrobiales bacterium]|nr:SDR family oxidoreductase [Thermomicrobiales bacterium]